MNFIKSARKSTFTNIQNQCVSLMKCWLHCRKKRGFSKERKWKMNRFTYKEPNGKWGIKGMNEENQEQKMYGVAAKLKDYEDTGLSPDQVERMIYELEDYKRIGLSPAKIKELDQLYLEKCREVNELRQQLAEVNKNSLDGIKFRPSPYRSYRDILFKAKRIYDGEWVMGSLIYSTDATEGFEAIIIPECNNNMFARDGDDEEVGDLGFENWYQVKQSTICQYTGMSDKNGRPIWEGDIVRYTFDSPDDPTATENGLRVRVGRIFFSEHRASFSVTGKRGSKCLNNDLYKYVRGANTVEVIGNIFDNPEYLGGE